MADNSCDCEKEVILIPGVGGVPGPQGPAGPQGPPGPGATFPIPAVNISVTNVGYLNLQEVIDDLLYVDMLINSFAISNFPGGIVEIGSSVSTLQFSWTVNKLPVTQTLSGPNIVTGNTTPGTVTATKPVSPALKPGSTGTSYTYTLLVSDDVLSPTRTATLTFLNNLYWGDAAAPGSIDSAFVNTLTKGLQATKNKIFVSNAGANVYAWYACRSVLGTPVFEANGFEGGFELAAAAVSVTNASGFAENYDVYRSINPEIGPVTIFVS